MYAEGQSISSHSGTAAKIGWILAKLAQEEHPEVDINKVTEMALWHDTEETRITDLGRDIRHYITINDEKALDDKFKHVSWGKEIIELKNKFEDKKPTDYNVMLAKDADVMYVILTIKELIKTGVAVHNPDERIKRTIKRLLTKEGIKLAEELAEMDPAEWWDVMMGYKEVDKEGKAILTSK
jgi:5'-deoxynucleotidase YfbR-like HD superfamily hydrolase